DLSINDHGVHQSATIFHDDVIQNFDDAGGGIHGDNCSMGGVGEGPAVALGAIALGDFETASVDVGGKGLRLQIPCARDPAQSNAAGSGDDVAILDPAGPC